MLINTDILFRALFIINFHSFSRLNLNSFEQLLGASLSSVGKGAAINQDHAGGGWVQIPVGLGIFRDGNFLDFSGHRV